MSGWIIAALNVAIYLGKPRLIWRFRRKLGYWPNPAHPRLYNEKYLWRKLFDHDPLFVTVTDKLTLKNWVAANFPDIKTPKLIWEGDDPAAIPASVLSGNVVVKVNHGCKWNRLIFDGQYDRAEVEAVARGWLAKRMARKKAEWAYSQIVPRLFVEEMLTEQGGPIRHEYKCYVAAGQMMHAYVKVDRFGDRPQDVVLDQEGHYRIMAIDLGTVTVPMDKPLYWERIVAAAKRLGAGFDLVRCDLYEKEGEIWVSEMTLYSVSGLTWVDDEQMMDRLGREWDIRKSWFMRAAHKSWRERYRVALRQAIEADDARPATPRRT